jgi:CII-binding regulator of phage lambda lysogenization HflD
MRKVPMSEIKIYNDIVSSVKNQIHGKAPDTIINIATQNNLAQQVDYSNMSQDELMKELAKIEAKEKLEGAIN